MISCQPFREKTLNDPPGMFIGNYNWAARARILDEVALRYSIDGPIKPIVNLISECVSLHSSANIYIRNGS
jgi:hypothetical protein